MLLRGEIFGGPLQCRVFPLESLYLFISGSHRTCPKTQLISTDRVDDLPTLSVSSNIPQNAVNQLALV
jgi:hypothetical protein